MMVCLALTRLYLWQLYEVMLTLSGLHLNDLGYRILHAEIRKVMAQTWPESDPEGFEKHFPEWTSWYMHTEEGRRCVREVKG